MQPDRTVLQQNIQSEYDFAGSVTCSVFAGTNDTHPAMTENSPELSAERQPQPPLRPAVRIAQSVLLVVFLLAIAAALALIWPGHRTDPRLLGTWQSDGDLTIKGILGEPPYDKKREAKLRNLFGKMRVTWTMTHCKSDLEGYLDSGTYKVLASDQNSVVVHFDDPKPSPLDGLDLKLSPFHVIHFEGPNTYWLDTQWGMQEYFKRVK